MIFLAAALALTPQQTEDVRCVAVIGIAAKTDRSLVQPGREFAARVGAEMIDSREATREEVGNAILAEGQRVAKAAPDKAETDRCFARMAEWLSQ